MPNPYRTPDKPKAKKLSWFWRLPDPFMGYIIGPIIALPIMTWAAAYNCYRDKTPETRCHLVCHSQERGSILEEDENICLCISSLGASCYNKSNYSLCTVTVEDIGE